jgi:hypothetical protein
MRSIANLEPFQPSAARRKRGRKARACIGAIRWMGRVASSPCARRAAAVDRGQVGFHHSPQLASVLVQAVGLGDHELVRRGGAPHEGRRWGRSSAHGPTPAAAAHRRDRLPAGRDGRWSRPGRAREPRPHFAACVASAVNDTSSRAARQTDRGLAEAAACATTRMKMRSRPTVSTQRLQRRLT